MSPGGALVLVVGATGQALFASRILLQWRAAERARRPVVPPRYWEVSIVAGGLVLLYGILERNHVYMLGVLPGCVASARNLALKRPASSRSLLPWALLLLVLSATSVALAPRRGSTLWAAIGLVGALLWSGRVLAQWWTSERAGRSTLPLSFWALSLAGGLTLSAYAVALRDPVMLSGYALGCVPYVRNLVLLRRLPGPARSMPSMLKRA